MPSRIAQDYPPNPDWFHNRLEQCCGASWTESPWCRRGMNARWCLLCGVSSVPCSPQASPHCAPPTSAGSTTSANAIKDAAVCQAVLALAHRCILPPHATTRNDILKDPQPLDTPHKGPKPKKSSPHSATHLRHPKRHESGSVCRWDDHRARSTINDQHKFAGKLTSVSRSCSTLNGFIGRNCYRHLKR